MSPEARERSFDALATGLASGSISRGRALRLMGAALVGGALGSLGIGEAAADRPGCKRTGKVCTKDKVCCSGNCDGVIGTCAACPPGTKLCSNGQCASCCAEDCSGCATCQSGTCACPADTHTVLANGTCARRCTGGASCPTGFCYDTNEGSFCAGGGGFGNCLGLGNAGCPTGSVCTGPDCLTVTC
jgi:hypothetical protein